ncbi:MAG: 23S rRNA (pseudouridine(1915)-N(3))-methyltransferase RlmH [Angelakisella sp.]
MIIILSVNLIAVGKLKEAWMRQGLAEYSKRLEAFCRFTITEIDEYKLPENPSPAMIEKGLAEEARAILTKAKGEIIALCIEGEQLSSPQLAAELAKLAQKTGAVSFVIGGSFGLAPQVKEAAILRLSVSEMTFPHQLFRVMLTEQIYRAFSIQNGGKYHK